MLTKNSSKEDIIGIRNDKEIENDPVTTGNNFNNFFTTIAKKKKKKKKLLKTLKAQSFLKNLLDNKQIDSMFLTPIDKKRNY